MMSESEEKQLMLQAIGREMSLDLCAHVKTDCT